MKNICLYNHSMVLALKKDLETLKTKYNDVSEKLLEKNRQYQKLQGMYETLRRWASGEGKM